MISDTTQPSSIEEPGSLVLPVATVQDREALLWRLKARRRELVAAYASTLDLDEPVSASALQPLATIQAAIEAVEAELGDDEPAADRHLRDEHGPQVTNMPRPGSGGAGRG